jgi:hypothetical protein
LITGRILRPAFSRLATTGIVSRRRLQAVPQNGLTDGRLAGTAYFLGASGFITLARAFRLENRRLRPPVPALLFDPFISWLRRALEFPVHVDSFLGALGHRRKEGIPLLNSSQKSAIISGSTTVIIIYYSIKEVQVTFSV